MGELARLANLSPRDASGIARVRSVPTKFHSNIGKYGSVKAFAEGLGNKRKLFESRYFESDLVERPMGRQGTRPDYQPDHVQEFAETLVYDLACTVGSPMVLRGTRKAKARREAVETVRAILERLGVEVVGPETPPGFTGEPPGDATGPSGVDGFDGPSEP